MTRIIESLKQAVRFAQGDTTAGRSVTLNITFPPASAKRLEQLAQATDVPGDLKEVIKEALQLYEGLVKELADGSKIIIRRADGTEVEAFESGEVK